MCGDGVFSDTKIIIEYRYNNYSDIFSNNK